MRQAANIYKSDNSLLCSAVVKITKTINKRSNTRGWGGYLNSDLSQCMEVGVRYQLELSNGARGIFVISKMNINSPGIVNVYFTGIGELSNSLS